MIELLKVHGWQFIERRTCCGPHKEKWKKREYTIIAYTGLQKYIVRKQGKHIITETSNKLNERLATIDKTFFPEKA